MHILITHARIIAGYIAQRYCVYRMQVSITLNHICSMGHTWNCFTGLLVESVHVLLLSQLVDSLGQFTVCMWRGNAYVCVVRRECHSDT